MNRATGTQPALLVEVTRGPLVESVHAGHVVVADPTGRVIAALGDPGHVTYWRSAAKPVQVLPLLALGGGERFRLTPEEIAVMTASHSGEPDHVALVRSILAKVGMTEQHLLCGAHPPLYAPAAASLAQQGQSPGPIHNNCSGKHAGMLALCALLGADPAGYLDPSHPVQKRIIQTVALLAGVGEDRIAIGVDGCGVPVFGLPVAAMATAYARLADPQHLPAQLAQAAEQVSTAMRTHPRLVAGTGRFGPVLVEASQGRLIAKSGAEAVFCVGDTQTGWGLALKISDGNSRAAAPATVQAVKRLGWVSESGAEALAPYGEPAIMNHAGKRVGELRPARSWNDFGVPSNSEI